MASRSPVLGFRLRTRILCRFETEVNGRQKRIFIAAVCEKLCDGSARKTEERFGWGREAIAKGLLERSSEPEEEVRLPRGGVKPSEVRNPQLAIDIRLIVEPHTHSDPKLKSTRLYTNFSAAQVRGALSNMGYTKDRLPSERTLRDILNRMNYRLKRIQKGQFRRIRSGGKEPEPTAKVTSPKAGIMIRQQRTNSCLLAY